MNARKQGRGEHYHLRGPVTESMLVKPGVPLRTSPGSCPQLFTTTYPGLHSIPRVVTDDGGESYFLLTEKQQIRRADIEQKRARALRFVEMEQHADRSLTDSLIELLLEASSTCS